MVIGAIVLSIWWLESRNDAGVSPSGEEYGPIELPSGWRTEGLDVRPEAGSLAPDFLLKQFEGGELRLSDLRGKPVVLNFWATWCAPCRKEMPQFVAASERYADEGLVIVGVNLQEGKSIIAGFVDDYGIEFPVVIDLDGEVGDEYRLPGLPSTFFVDSDGVVRSVFAGPLLDKSGEVDVQDAIELSELDRRIEEIIANE